MYYKIYLRHQVNNMSIHFQLGMVELGLMSFNKIVENVNIRLPLKYTFHTQCFVGGVYFSVN